MRNGNANSAIVYTFLIWSFKCQIRSRCLSIPPIPLPPSSLTSYSQKEQTRSLINVCYIVSESDRWVHIPLFLRYGSKPLTLFPPGRLSSYNRITASWSASARGNTSTLGFGSPLADMSCLSQSFLFGKHIELNPIRHCDSRRGCLQNCWYRFLSLSSTAWTRTCNLTSLHQLLLSDSGSGEAVSVSPSSVLLVGLERCD